MIHPSAELRRISDSIGYGIFAKEDIPKGTVTCVKDPLDLVIPSGSPLIDHPLLGPFIDTYSYGTVEKDLVLSWDHAKYTNHCCFANTLFTAWGFEIAVQDISRGQEITTDYGLLTIWDDFEISCTKRECRKFIRMKDFDDLVLTWDKSILNAILLIKEVPQPLKILLNKNIIAEIDAFLMDHNCYRSVASLKKNTRCS